MKKKWRKIEGKKTRNFGEQKNKEKDKRGWGGPRAASVGTHLSLRRRRAPPGAFRDLFREDFRETRAGDAELEGAIQQDGRKWGTIEDEKKTRVCLARAAPAAAEEMILPAPTHSIDLHFVPDSELRYVLSGRFGLWTVPTYSRKVYVGILEHSLSYPRPDTSLTQTPTRLAKSRDPRLSPSRGRTSSRRRVADSDFGQCSEIARTTVLDPSWFLHETSSPRYAASVPCGSLAPRQVVV